MTNKFDQKHLRTFCIIETGGEGGCGNFKVVSERQNMSKLYYAHLPKRESIGCSPKQKKAGGNRAQTKPNRNFMHILLLNLKL